ncbi:hypothetical protein Tco_0427346 [Tanacetum coccineum]
MFVDLQYVHSLKKEIDELESDKADLSNIYDLLLQECVSKDVMCSYLHYLSDLDAHTELQCLSFAKLEQHSISFEIALQQCQEQMKNDTVCKQNESTAFLKEREQYFEIQDLKAQLQDKNIAISEDQLCSSCELTKAKQSTFKTKNVPSSKGRLNLLHMDLCGPMRIESINGKKYILIEMDPNTSIGRLCLGENNQGSVAEGIANKEKWEGPKFQDTSSSGQEKKAKVFTFYRKEEEGERYFTLCYVGGLHAYDGEINLKYEKNLILNKFTVKLCLEYEEKNGEKLVKRELLVSLKREFYFVKFIVNPEEDDVKPSVILGRISKNLLDRFSQLY